MTEYSNVTGAELKNKDCNQVVLGSYMIAVSFCKMARSSASCLLFAGLQPGDTARSILPFRPARGLRMACTKQELRAFAISKSERGRPRFRRAML